MVDGIWVDREDKDEDEGPLIENLVNVVLVDTVAIGTPVASIGVVALAAVASIGVGALAAVASIGAPVLAVVVDTDSPSD